MKDIIVKALCVVWLAFSFVSFFVFSFVGGGALINHFTGKDFYTSCFAFGFAYWILQLIFISVMLIFDRKSGK